MELANYDTAAVMDASEQARYALDSKLMVNFYNRAVQNRFRSDQEGRPIFDDAEFVRIIIPGDTKTIIDTKVTPEYRARFRQQYEKFKRNQIQAISGTPLEVWTQLTVSQVAELKAMNIATVEQLSDLPDALAQRIMGAHDLRRRAKQFLDSAAGEAANSKMAAELEKRDSEIAALKTQMEQLILSMQQQNAAKVPHKAVKE